MPTKRETVLLWYNVKFHINITISTVDNTQLNLNYYLLCRAGGGPHIEPQYRQYPQITKKQKFESEFISGAMWFWILWHLWHDPDAVLVRSISFDP